MFNSTHCLSLRLCSLLSSLCFSLYVFCSSARRTRYSTSTASNMSTDILLYSCREERQKIREKKIDNSITFHKKTDFHPWVTIKFFFILPAPPSSVSSYTSCWGPAFWADLCGTVALWPPTGSVCLLQEDSPDPLMLDLDRRETVLKH